MHIWIVLHSNCPIKCSTWTMCSLFGKFIRYFWIILSICSTELDDFFSSFIFLDQMSSTVFWGFCEWHLLAEKNKRIATTSKSDLSEIVLFGVSVVEKVANMLSKRKLPKKFTLHSYAHTHLSHRHRKHLLRWLEAILCVCKICKSCVYWSETRTKF